VSLALGILPADLDITAHELMEWAAFEHVQGPILIHERIDAGFARLAGSLGGRPPEDYMPRWDDGSRSQQTPEQMIAVFESALPKGV
jgi:hypothetical protein